MLRCFDKNWLNSVRGFLSARGFENQRLLRERNKKKFKTRLRKQKKALEDGEIAFSEMKDSIDSWKVHASHADTENLKEEYIGKLWYKAVISEFSI